MKFLRNILDELHPQFIEGGKYEKLYPLYEALDTFAFTPGEVSTGSTHVRDSMDMKRLMVTVVISLIPVTLMGIWNAGYQAITVLAEQNVGSWADVDGWRAAVMNTVGLGLDPSSLANNLIYGALFFLPIYAITMFVGGHIELIFAIIRKHEINEGGFWRYWQKFPERSLDFQSISLFCLPRKPFWGRDLGSSRWSYCCYIFGVSSGRRY